MRCLEERQREVEIEQTMNRHWIEIDRTKITCSGASGSAYSWICFYWIADSLTHTNMPVRAPLSDWIKYIGYGPRCSCSHRSSTLDQYHCDAVSLRLETVTTGFYMYNPRPNRSYRSPPVLFCQDRRDTRQDVSYPWSSTTATQFRYD
ncbi:hypothetical protein Y032_0044g954 [Ancylostoma ceylanicum]|uniref:Uncharacterized protein n=1 Tax=Ancylostoma ceylanicum TaxID=53326 RepID=A0A016UEL9_9BILA|nr:hypothetical protein Y032_0044g954 [Ancylostoma ceylanicum]